MNELQIFQNSEFGQVRTLEENGKVLFGATECAKVLGYSNPYDAIIRHCKSLVKREGVSITINQHGKSTEQLDTINFIPEGDLYRLIAHSKLPAAEKFERWVFDEVLPSIRKHGLYAKDELLDNPDLFIEILTNLKQERQEKKLLQSQNVQLEQRISEYEPKVQYLDTILQSKGTLTVTQIAADYGMTAYQLNGILQSERVQHKVGKQWILYKEHLNKSYTKSETIYFEHSDGTPDTTMHTRWRQKGRLMIHNILERCGIKANMDRGM